MSDTSIAQTPEQRTRTAPGYDGKGNQMPEPPSAFGAAAGLKSDVRDLLKYTAWEVTERDEAVRISHQPTATIPPKVTGLKWPYHSALNWQELEASDGGVRRRVIWQSGGLDGYHSYCILEPEEAFSLVVLFNETDDQIGSAQNEMVKAILTGIDAKALPLP
jgi:D-alanyl-D-alanine-carboxypeptidase/D-alanyl-D-alanine-endopeptidase